MTKSWFVENNVKLIPWPACSPDLNIIENVWSQLARAFHHNNRQFSSTEDRKNAISQAYQNIETEYIRTLFQSMPRRCGMVPERCGNPIEY